MKINTLIISSFLLIHYPFLHEISAEAVGQMTDGAKKVEIPIPRGGERITYVNSTGIGKIAVRIKVPLTPRYPEGAPIVFNVGTFFGNHSGFNNQIPETMIGAIESACLWPGEEDTLTGAASEGTYDYCGPNCLAALCDAIRFISGDLPNVDGDYINEMVDLPILTNNVGLFAFSHAGLGAINVLAHHGNLLPKIRYFVGRENPTIPQMNTLEAGYMNDYNQPILNPCYNYPDDYTTTMLNIDYSNVDWIWDPPDGKTNGRPVFRISGGDDHILSWKGPTMWDNKRYYSVSLTQALLNNGALTINNWPSDLATVEETMSHWPFRTSATNYTELSQNTPQLKVMLVFSKDDHVQAAPDKPHIHQAYDGLKKTSNLWVRMNPDLSYVQSINSEYDTGFPDNPACEEPLNWLNIRDWAYPNLPGTKIEVPLAAVAEMADRVYEDNWSPNLEHVSFSVYTSIEKLSHETIKYALYQNYPNPFNPVTTISYDLSESCFVTLKIFNIRGREMQTIVNEWKQNGYYNVRWHTGGLPAGIYLYRLQAGDYTETRKLILQK